MPERTGKIEGCLTIYLIFIPSDSFWTWSRDRESKKSTMVSTRHQSSGRLKWLESIIKCHRWRTYLEKSSQILPRVPPVSWLNSKLLMDKVTHKAWHKHVPRKEKRMDIKKKKKRKTNGDVKRRQLWQYMQARETFLFWSVAGKEVYWTCRGFMKRPEKLIVDPKRSIKA